MRSWEELLVYSTKVYKMQNLFTEQKWKITKKDYQGINQVCRNRAGYSFSSRVANVGSTYYSKAGNLGLFILLLYLLGIYVLYLIKFSLHWYSTKTQSMKMDPRSNQIQHILIGLAWRETRPEMICMENWHGETH